MSLNYDSQVIERVKAAEKFNDRFQKTNADTRKLFLNLIGLVCEEKILNKATNTPDYRLVRKNGRINFCLITFSGSSVKVHLQRNRAFLESDIFMFRPITEGRYNGTDWVEFKITNAEEVEEAFRLIQEIYNKD